MEKVQELFKTMVYGENIENTSQGSGFMQSIEISDKSSDLDNILNNVKTKAYVPKRSHFTKLAEELERNVQTICEIECLSRGILSKNTKEAVRILAQYFYYYATLIEGDSKGVAVGVFGNNHPLWSLGLFLGPALASGHTVLLQTGTKMAFAATYLLNLAAKAGIPKEALILIPSDDDELQPYFSYKDVILIALFRDAFQGPCRAINKAHKKVLIFSAHKTPMLIFDDADLESAVESAIEATWTYKGMLPWSVDTIYIQENIFKQFTGKLKSRLATIRVGALATDKMADLTCDLNAAILENKRQIVDKARAMGIETFQIGDDPTMPTLIIGFKMGKNDVLEKQMVNDTLTLLPFRSIDEAASLAGNTVQGLGASVWTENIGLANEVARKLNVANVWINSFGLFSPHIPIAPMKESGLGFFGGKEGLREYVNQVKASEPIALYNLPNSFKIVDSLKSAINSNKSRNKTSKMDKIKTFLRLMDFIDENKKSLSENLPEKWLDLFKSDVNELLKHSQTIGSETESGFNVQQLKCPKGIMIIEMRNPLESHLVKLMLAAIFEDNGVILLNETMQAQDFYGQVAKILPTGQLRIFPYSLDAVNTASKHRELNGYYSNQDNVIFGSLPLNEAKLFQLVDNSSEWDDIFNLVRTFKNVWTGIGQSNQCNL